MTRARKKPLEPPGIVVWGWYAVAILAIPTGGTVAGLAVRGGARAFWAAWWTEDPRIADAEPDDYGFIDGAGLIQGEAIGAAYDALRAARGPRVYGRGIDGSFAIKAYREGAPRRRAVAVDFEALALVGFEELGLAPTATPAEVSAAFKAHHPDQGGKATDMHRLTDLYRAALAFAKRRQDERMREAIAAGARPERKKKRPKKRDEGVDLFGAGEAKERRGRQPRPLRNPARGTEEV